MSLLVERLQKMGGRVSTDELVYQMKKHHGLALSGEEVENNLRHEELAGRVRSFTYFSVVSPSERKASSSNGVGA